MGAIVEEVGECPNTSQEKKRQKRKRKRETESLETRGTRESHLRDLLSSSFSSLSPLSSSPSSSSSSRDLSSPSSPPSASFLFHAQKALLHRMLYIHPNSPCMDTLHSLPQHPSVHAKSSLLHQPPFKQTSSLSSLPPSISSLSSSCSPSISPSSFSSIPSSSSSSSSSCSPLQKTCPWCDLLSSSSPRLLRVSPWTSSQDSRDKLRHSKVGIFTPRQEPAKRKLLHTSSEQSTLGNKSLRGTSLYSDVSQLRHQEDFFSPSGKQHDYHSPSLQQNCKGKKFLEKYAKEDEREISLKDSRFVCEEEEEGLSDIASLECEKGKKKREERREKRREVNGNRKVDQKIGDKDGIPHEESAFLSCCKDFHSPFLLYVHPRIFIRQQGGKGWGMFLRGEVQHGTLLFVARSLLCSWDNLPLQSPTRDTATVLLHLLRFLSSLSSSSLELSPALSSAQSSSANGENEEVHDTLHDHKKQKNKKGSLSTSPERSERIRDSCDRMASCKKKKRKVREDIDRGGCGVLGDANRVVKGREEKTQPLRSRQIFSGCTYTRDVKACRGEKEEDRPCEEEDLVEDRGTSQEEEDDNEHTPEERRKEEEEEEREVANGFSSLKDVQDELRWLYPRTHLEADYTWEKLIGEENQEEVKENEKEKSSIIKKRENILGLPWTSGSFEVDRELKIHLRFLGLLSERGDLPELRQLLLKIRLNILETPQLADVLGYHKFFASKKTISLVPAFSLLNHSCTPNVTVHTLGDLQLVFARGHIGKRSDGSGENRERKDLIETELCFAYGGEAAAGECGVYRHRTRARRWGGGEGGGEEEGDESENEEDEEGEEEGMDKEEEEEKEEGRRKTPWDFICSCQRCLLEKREEEKKRKAMTDVKGEEEEERMGKEEEGEQEKAVGVFDEAQEELESMRPIDRISFIKAILSHATPSSQFLSSSSLLPLEDLQNFYAALGIANLQLRRFNQALRCWAEAMQACCPLTRRFCCFECGSYSPFSSSRRNSLLFAKEKPSKHKRERRCLLPSERRKRKNESTLVSETSLQRKAICSRQDEEEEEEEGEEEEKKEEGEREEEANEEEEEERSLCECGYRMSLKEMRESLEEVFGTAELSSAQRQLLLSPVDLRAPSQETQEDHDESKDLKRRSKKNRKKIEGKKKMIEKSKKSTGVWRCFYGDVRTWHLSGLICFATQAALSCFLRLATIEEEEEKEEEEEGKEMKMKKKKKVGDVSMGQQEEEKEEEEGMNCQVGDMEKKKNIKAFKEREGSFRKRQKQRRKSVSFEKKRLHLIARIALRHASRLHATLYGGDERLYLLRYGGDIRLSFLKEAFRGQELRLILKKRRILNQIEEIVLHKRRRGRKGRTEMDERKKEKEEKEKEEEGTCCSFSSSSSSSLSSSSFLSPVGPWCVWDLSDEPADYEISTGEEIEEKEDGEREEGDDKALLSAISVCGRLIQEESLALSTFSTGLSTSIQDDGRSLISQNKEKEKRVTQGFTETSLPPHLSISSFLSLIRSFSVLSFAFFLSLSFLLLSPAVGV